MKRHLLIVLFLMLLPFDSFGQDVAPVTHYVATVDSLTQCIVLRWDTSATTGVIGYHICSGNPDDSDSICYTYDTIFAQDSTILYCIDHSVFERHFYRINAFAFDSTINRPIFSALTEKFSPMVLHAEFPECESAVHVEWTPYTGMPGGVWHYSLYMSDSCNVEVEPVMIYTTVASGSREFSFEMADYADFDCPRLWVEAVGVDSKLKSRSNIAGIRRRTADTAAFITIDSAFYYTDNSANLVFHLDTAFPADHYTLYRRCDDGPWQVLVTLHSGEAYFSYIDYSISIYDSIYCYKLSVLDGCGIDEKFSNEACVPMPAVPDIAVAIPNTIIVGDPDNGVFLPRFSGLKGDIYEMYIYNREGFLVFHTTDSEQGWRPEVPQGAYVFFIRVRFVDNRIKTYTGTVTVIK